mmetsp:Transcript_15428/g.37965  ORF Transcript_15428/g.37965 Transcript_15428/m.37965 type:complete len:257 (-) Transcript_15428:178-948(-)
MGRRRGVGDWDVRLLGGGGDVLVVAMVFVPGVLEDPRRLWRPVVKVLDAGLPRSRPALDGLVRPLGRAAGPHERRRDDRPGHVQGAVEGQTPYADVDPGGLLQRLYGPLLLHTLRRVAGGEAGEGHGEALPRLLHGREQRERRADARAAPRGLPLAARRRHLQAHADPAGRRPTPPDRSRGPAEGDQHDPPDVDCPLAPPGGAVRDLLEGRPRRDTPRHRAQVLLHRAVHEPRRGESTPPSLSSLLPVLVFFWFLV